MSRLCDVLAGACCSCTSSSPPEWQVSPVIIVHAFSHNIVKRQARPTCCKELLHDFAARDCASRQTTALQFPDEPVQSATCFTVTCRVTCQVTKSIVPATALTQPQQQSDCTSASQTCMNAELLMCMHMSLSVLPGLRSTLLPLAARIPVWVDANCSN